MDEWKGVGFPQGHVWVRNAGQSLGRWDAEDANHKHTQCSLRRYVLPLCDAGLYDTRSMSPMYEVITSSWGDHRLAARVKRVHHTPAVMHDGRLRVGLVSTQAGALFTKKFSQKFFSFFSHSMSLPMTVTQFPGPGEGLVPVTHSSPGCSYPLCDAGGCECVRERGSAPTVGFARGATSLVAAASTARTGRVHRHNCDMQQEEATACTPVQCSAAPRGALAPTGSRCASLEPRCH